MFMIPGSETKASHYKQGEEKSPLRNFYQLNQEDF